LTFDVQRLAFGGAVRTSEFAQFLSLDKGVWPNSRPLINALDFGYLKPETFSELDNPAQTNAPHEPNAER
jgi:hypothetical protein